MTITTIARAVATAVVALAGLAVATAPATAHDFGKGPPHGRAVHAYPPHHHHNPHWFGYGPYGRPHGYYRGILPVPIVLGILSRDYGYYRVYTVRYREPIYWRGYGPLYRFGAYVAEVPGHRGGRVLIHLDPHTGRVIGKVHGGHWR